MLLEYGRTAFLKKGELLLELGEVESQISLLMDGILRGFQLDSNGRDITDCFVWRCGEAVMGSSRLGRPAQISIEAMTDCQLFQIPAADVERLLREMPALQELYVRYLVDALERHWEVKRIMYQPADQRYIWFLERYPGLISLVSNKHVASFLGMTPVTLSRVRRKIRETASKKRGAAE